MKTEQGFTLHPGAAQDITDIWEFILEDNPLAARRVREDILDAVRTLVPFPHQGHKRPDLTTKPLRFQTVRNYIIAYAHRTKSRLWACGARCAAWSPQPSRNRSHSARKRVISPYVDRRSGQSQH